MSTFLKRFDEIEVEEQKVDEQARKRLSGALRARDREMEAERQWSRNNQCPHCSVALTTLGNCTNDCGYKKDMKASRIGIAQKETTVKKDAFQIAREKREAEKKANQKPALSAQAIEDLMKKGLTLEEALVILMK